ILDLIVASLTGDNKPAPLTIFLGKGDGTFQPRKLHPVFGSEGQSDLAPKLIDINRDGLLDIIAVGLSSGFVMATFTVNFNRGCRSDSTLGFQVTVQSSTNRALVLERSIDFQVWSPIATNTPAGDWSVVDTQGSLAPLLPDAHTLN